MDSILLIEDEAAIADTVVFALESEGFRAEWVTLGTDGLARLQRPGIDLLFAILRSEDNALLMGSLLLFAVLTLVMLTTRRLDWFAIGERTGRQTTQGQTAGKPVSG